MIINYSVRPSLVAAKFGKSCYVPRDPNRPYPDQLIHRGQLVVIAFGTDSGKIYLEVDEERLQESMTEANQLLKEKKLPVSFEGHSLLTTETLPFDSSLMESVGFKPQDNGVWQWKDDSSPSPDDTLTS